MYDRGTPILPCLYSCLDVQCIISETQVSLFGCLELLQCGNSEYSKNLHSVIVNLDASWVFPRILFRCTNNRRTRDNESRHVYSFSHNQIDLRIYNGKLIWYPFDTNDSIELKFIQLARLLIVRRFPSVSYPSVFSPYWYPGDRCWRHFHNHDAILEDPHLHTYQRMIYDLGQLAIMRAKGWWLADRFIITLVHHTWIFGKDFTQHLEILLLMSHRYIW